MRAGKLRHRLALQNSIQTYDANGGPIDTFSTFATVWGSVGPVSGREKEFGDQITAEATHAVRIRYDSTIGVESQIVHLTRTLKIINVLDTDDRAIEQVLLCKELL